MIRLSASTLMYAGYPLETALRELSIAGIRAVDLWAAPRLCLHVDPLADDPAVIRRLLDDFGLLPAALSIYGSDVTRALAAIDFAAAIRAPVVVTGAGVRSLAEAIGYLGPLVKRAASRNVIVAPENHIDSPLESLAEMQGLLVALDSPSLGITYAPPHSYACGECPEIVILALGSRLVFFYPWDIPQNYRRGSRESFWSDPEGQMPGRGGLDFDVIFRALRGIGYTGYANLVWHGSRDWELQEITSAICVAARFVAKFLH